MISQRFTPVYTAPYQNCRDKLGDDLKTDLDEKITQLLNDPSSIAVPLKWNLKDKHKVKFGGNQYRPSHRLIIRINHSDKTISFLYLTPGKVVYENDLTMWA